MPLKQFTKEGTSTLGVAKNANDTNEGILKKAAIFRVDSDGTILENAAGVFLLNPTSFEDVNSANWAPQKVPGQSNDILQWISSGPRTVNFEALVTADTSEFDSNAVKKPGDDSVTNNVLQKIGSLAASFFNVTTPPPPARNETQNNGGDSLDITNYLNYYRSLLYPVYDDINNPKKLNQSPPLVVLYFGKALIKKRYEKRISNNHDVWVVTNLRINVTKQLPNLAPMEARVTFTLVQYSIKSFDTRRFING